MFDKLITALVPELPGDRHRTLTQLRACADAARDALAIVASA